MSAPPTHRSADLIRDPIPKLIRTIAIPASVGFFFNTMYNVVDTWFAGLISTNALAALSLSFPIFFILIATGTGIAQGSTALIANALGAGDKAKAQLYSLQAIAFGIILSVGLTALGLVIAPSMFRFLGASEDYLAICLAYMRPVLCGTVFFLLQSISNASLTALGDLRTFRDVLIAGFLLNLILDPWLLFGGLGVPPLGIRGIALATVIVQILGTFFILHRVRKSSLWENINTRLLIPRWDAFRDIAVQGIPASFNMMTVALGIFIITWFISKFSKEGVAAYGIATRVEQMILLPTIGLNMAVLTLVGQNNGAGLPDRVRQTWRTTIQYGIVMMLIGGLLLLALPNLLMSVFTKDTVVIRLGAEYLRVAAITLCSYVILFQTVFMLQGLKRPMYGAWIGLYRQVAAPCLVFYLLAFKLDWQLRGIWWGIFLVTWSAALVTLFYGRRVLRRLPSS